MSEYVYRVHPAINFARVGNSEEYYIAPETMAGLPIEGNDTVTGGLPINPDTEKFITSKDLRDRNGALKRQAARFRIFLYPKRDKEVYPNGEGVEIKIGSCIDGRTVTDIVWTVHVANKKANSYVLENPNLAPHESVIDGYKYGNLPPLRNLNEGADPQNASRIRKLTIDPGPRTIKGSYTGMVRFDKQTIATFAENGTITPILNYPKSFPDDSFSKLYSPRGPIDTLGELKTDEQGRLLVLPGYGRACSWYASDNTPYPLSEDVDNDGWFDDTSDGPVSAVIVFDDDSTAEVHGAWVVATDPAYAPQILNVVSLWDDIYDSWVRKLKLSPEIFKNRFQENYKPSFSDQIFPIFRAASLIRWNTNLPKIAVRAHNAVGKIQATDDPATTILAGLGYIRNPNMEAQQSVGAPLMPLSLGDQGQAFLSPTLTQYFFLSQWDRNHYEQESSPTLGPGEYLDRAVLVNCLGGRFSPGIDMTFIVREPEIYINNWKTSGTGPFRIHPKRLDYKRVQASQPFLTEGYVPLHSPPDGLEPGDTSKFMALPWHTDYNSCATHPTSPTTRNSSTLYWSWPAQRPVAVYVANEVDNGELGPQRYSVRGHGTHSNNPAGQGRYQQNIDIVKNWPRIGIVMQGSAIVDKNGTPYNPDFYLEAEGLLDDPEVQPWPINATE